MLSFPPFYTLQPHPPTQARQLGMWRDIILENYSEAPFKLSRKDSLLTSGPRPMQEALWNALVQFMQREGRLTSLETTDAFLVWPRLPMEWALLLEEAVKACGQGKSVMTVAELFEETPVMGRSKTGLPEPCWPLIIDALAGLPGVSLFSITEDSSSIREKGIKFDLP